MPAKAFILAATRVPTAKKSGTYARLLPEWLLAKLIERSVQEFPILATATTQVIAACSLGTGGNMARYAALEANLPIEVQATTIDGQCVGFYAALQQACYGVWSGQQHCVAVGGMESNSLAPERFYQPADPRYKNNEPFAYASFAPPSFGNSSLIAAATKVAEAYHISADLQIEQAILSHARAYRTREENLLKSIMVEVENLATDETIRSEEDARRLGEKMKGKSLVNPLTSAHYTDGVSLVWLVSEEFLADTNLQPLALVKDIAIVGGLPDEAPITFIAACQQLQAKYPEIWSRVGVVEVNESFALKPLVFQQHFQFPSEKVNIFGGNLAYGHPFAAAGGLNIAHLLRAMQHRSERWGVATGAAAGGLGAAILIENLRM